MPTTSTEQRKPVTRLTTNRTGCEMRTSNYNRMTMMWGTTKTGQTMPVPLSGPLSSFFFQNSFLLSLLIKQIHEEVYVRVCEENGWAMQLPKRKRQLDFLLYIHDIGYTNIYL